MGRGSPRWAAPLLLVLLAAIAVEGSPAAAEACRVPAEAEAVLGPSSTCSPLDRRLGDPVGVIEVSYPDAFVK
jgi:hypothetical protein